MSPITKKTRKIVSLDVKIEMLDRLQAGEGPTAVGKYFGVSESTVRSIRKNEAAIRKAAKTNAKISPYTRDVVLQKTEKDLMMWIEGRLQKKLPVNRKAIKQSALKFYEQIRKLHVDTSSHKKFKFHASNGWLEGFLKRYKIKGNGEKNHQDKVTPETVKVEVEDEQVMEETEIQQETISNGSCESKVQETELKAVKDCMTHLCTSEDRILKPLILNHSYIKALLNDTPLQDDEMVETVSKSSEIEEVYEQFNSGFTPNVILEGLQLASNLDSYFTLHDPNEERSEKFSRQLRLLMSSYRQLYRDLSKAPINEFIPNCTETASGHFVQDIKVEVEFDDDNSMFN